MIFILSEQKDSGHVICNRRAIFVRTRYTEVSLGFGSRGKELKTSIPMVTFGKVFSTPVRRVDQMEEDYRLEEGEGEGNMWAERCSEGGLVGRLWGLTSSEGWVQEEGPGSARKAGFRPHSRRRCSGSRTSPWARRL